MVNNSQLQTTNSSQPLVRQSIFGLRGRLLTLAILPVLLAGTAILYSVFINVDRIVNGLYERQTNKTMQVLLGNIDFTQPKEIERELKQAMRSSDLLAMHFTFSDTTGQQRSQMIFRDAEAKTKFEARNPAYLIAMKGGSAMERQFFEQFNFINSEGNTWVTRGTGRGGSNGATETSMLGLQDESKLSIPNGNSTTTGFGFVVAEDGDKLRDDLWTIAWIIIGSIVGAVVAAMIAGYFVAQSIVRPIVKLTKLADAMSIGELETPIDIKSRDEIGALGESLERTRLSLKLALERTQRKRTDRSSETTSPR